MERKRIIPVVLLLLLFIGESPRRTGARPLGPMPGQQSRVTQETETKSDVEDKSSITEKVTYALPLLEGVIDPERYVLGPYDRLVLNLHGPEPRSFSLTVLPEGDVFIPGVGTVRADGRTLSQFRNDLAERVGEFFKNIELFCYLEVPRTFRVFVTGDVNNPGAVEVSAVERVSEAIKRAGGIKGGGSQRCITLDRRGDTLIVDMVRFHLLGDLESNPFLSSGDRIYVPAGGLHATIHGPVGRAGYYEILPGETIGDLVKLAGDFLSEAVVDSVLLSRIDEKGNVEMASVPSSRYGMVLRDRDEVSVYGISEKRRRVYVYGAFKRPGRYYLSPGEGLAELLVRVGALDDMADLENAALERKDGEIIKLNLLDYLQPNPKKNVILEDEDALGMSWKDAKVRVGGEVQLPGDFPHMNDWTVSKYIGMAGGPTENGSMNRIEIYSADGTKRKGSPKSRPNRGDVIIVKRSRSKILGQLVSGLAQIGTIVITIIVLSE
jgi:protein involved in polysaccharide export with SLBB domain